MVRIVSSSRLLDTRSIFRKQLYFHIPAINIAERIFLMLFAIAPENIKYIGVYLMKYTATGNYKKLLRRI